MGKLTTVSVKAAKEAGRYSDGDGLYLKVEKSGSKSWMVRVQKNGRRRDIGLGSASKVPLKIARERAALVRTQVELGVDPVSERRRASHIPSFRDAALMVHSEHLQGWKNGKHRQQWISTLEAYAFPAFGHHAVSSVDAAAVRDVLAAIWLTKPETARRLRQRIRTVIDWSVAKGFREASLPMPVIDKALPRQRHKPNHHKALPYDALPEFMRQLCSQETVGRLALEALILTAARSGDVRGMKWREIDLEEMVWSVPVEDGRGKGGRVHNVPISAQFAELLRRAEPHRRPHTDLVFPGSVKGKPLSDNTLRKIAIKMGYPITVHGFRSTFADWVNEQTSFPREVREAALGHVNANKAEVAYSRTDYLEKRRPMMEAWGNFASGGGSGNVVRFAR